MRTILIVDDHENIRLVLRAILERNGYCCIEAAGGTEALELMCTCKPDLVLLDVMMPDMDGFEVCERIRSFDTETPVLFLSAKDDMVDKRIGYRLGADDYMTKPFNEEEVALRVGALLRRAAINQNESTSAPENHIASATSITVGAIRIDLLKHQVFVHGASVVLTPTEFKLLCTFASNPGVVFSKEELVERVWGRDYVGDSVSIPAHIRHLRSKIEENASSPRYIETVWGFGYKLSNGKP